MTGSPKAKLYIAISAYGRPSYRLRILEAFIAVRAAARRLGSELLVVDNDLRGYEALRTAYADTPGVRWHSNAANIGGSTNYLRNIEVAGADYVWLLGDDAAPRFDAANRY